MLSHRPSAARRTCFALLAAAATAIPVAAAAETVYPLDSITVVARRVTFGTSAAISSREELNRSLERLGLSLVRRGVALGTDLYADGFKRADLAVVVDGERYHCACPNRMDPPTSLAIPIELADASWDRASGGLGAGLAGRLALRREAPSETWRARGAAEGDLLRSRDGSASFALEGRGQRLSGRVMGGESYEDGGGATFRDRYGFRDERVRYGQGDLAWRGARGRAAWGVQGTVTRDVPYAYLLMDERVNDLWNASFAHGDLKAYASHARHLMDNGLRTSSAGPMAMGMSTAADQTTVGVLGRAAGAELEAWGREWNANNTIATAMRRAENHLMPRYRQWAVNAARKLAAGPVAVSARAGLSRAGIGDGAALARYRALHPDAEGERWFAPFALSATRTFGGAARWSAMAEVASEPPGAEQLYITVRRPMMAVAKPDWTGNPALAAPLRGSLRGQLATSLATLELGGSWVDGYVLPVARRAGTTPHVTYANTDAALLSGRASGRLAWAEWALAYTLGWNLDARTELAEIAPFTASLVARPPLGAGVEGLVRIETAARQYRVDEALGETGTPAWGRLDLGLGWSPRPGARASLEVVNVTDALYGEHLSYARDPFAAGLRVMSPGRTVRLAVTMGE